jgi:hypothetical protein
MSALAERLRLHVVELLAEHLITVDRVQCEALLRHRRMRQGAVR